MGWEAEKSGAEAIKPYLPHSPYRLGHRKRPSTD